MVRLAVHLERQPRIIAFVREVDSPAATSAVDERELWLDLTDPVTQQREQEFIDEKPFAVLRDARSEAFVVFSEGQGLVRQGLSCNAVLEFM